jgi:hypothetical protein
MPKRTTTTTHQNGSTPPLQSGQIDFGEFLDLYAKLKPVRALLSVWCVFLLGRQPNPPLPATPSDAWRVCGSAAEGILIVICACVYVSLHVLLLGWPTNNSLLAAALCKCFPLAALPSPLFCVYHAPQYTAAFTITTTIVVVVSITPPLRPVEGLARPSKKCVVNEKGCSVLGEGVRKKCVDALVRLLPPGLEVHDVVLEVPEPLDDLSPELEELAPASR